MHRRLTINIETGQSIYNLSAPALTDSGQKCPIDSNSDFNDYCADLVYPVKNHLV